MALKTTIDKWEGPAPVCLDPACKNCGGLGLDLDLSCLGPDIDTVFTEYPCWECTAEGRAQKAKYGW